MRDKPPGMELCIRCRQMLTLKGTICARCHIESQGATSKRTFSPPGTNGTTEKCELCGDSKADLTLYRDIFMCRSCMDNVAGS